jgi:hypothetical protein
VNTLEPTDRKPVRHPRTASRVFSGEAVVISPAENTVRMFNAVGSRVWELADGSRTTDEIVLALTQEYEVEPAEARASVLGFLEELEAKGLVSYADEK